VSFKPQEFSQPFFYISDFVSEAKSCCDGNHGNEEGEGKRTALSNDLVPDVKYAFLLNVHPRQKLV